MDGYVMASHNVIITWMRRTVHQITVCSIHNEIRYNYNDELNDYSNTCFNNYVNNNNS